MIITDKLLVAYAEGKVTQQEKNAVRQYLTQNPSAMDYMLMLMDNDFDLEPKQKTKFTKNKETATERMDNLIEEAKVIPLSATMKPADTFIQVLPATAKAAQNMIDNACAIHCEWYVLNRLGYNMSVEELTKESKEAKWIKEEGTPLHNIGRLAGARGLSVSRRYECTSKEIKNTIASNGFVIAVVNKDILDGYDEYIELPAPNHAVIIKAIIDEEITIIDPGNSMAEETYPLEQFLEAWSSSVNYLIAITNAVDYNPHPIDTTDVTLEEELNELMEAIAENAHEVWGLERQKEGWTYGPLRDDIQKHNPDMIAYSRLPESEKQYDRAMAEHTLKLVKKLGWDIIKRKK